jgi:anaerobic magnesium-protoporphyrin IX monomethyl ester cyclase
MGAAKKGVDIMARVFDKGVVLCCVPIMDRIGEKLIPVAQDAFAACPAIGIYLLAAILRDHGYKVTIADFTAAWRFKLEGVAVADDRILRADKLKRIEKIALENLKKLHTSPVAQASEEVGRIDKWLPILREAGLIGISGTSLNWPSVLMVVRQIRDAGISAPIVVGGVHPTMFADYILQSCPLIDFVIRHEGEKALLKLCEALEGQLEYEKVPNLSWRTKDGRIVHNSTIPPLTVDELVSLPTPAYDLLPPKSYPLVALQSSRGCPFCCCFCSTPFRRSYRPIPASAFVDKLEEAMSLAADRVMARNIVQIMDDEWSVDRKRAIEIIHEVARRNLHVKFIYDSRANDFLDEKYAGAVAPYTERFLVGAECGYNEGLTKVGKGTTVEKLENCARVLSKYGIAERAEFSFILGLPWESHEQVLQTIRFATHLVLEYGVNVMLQWYCQIPGSLLWDESWQRGDVTPAMYDEFGFFRNLYLFRTGVHLTIEEIQDAIDAISTAHSLIVLAGRSKGSMAYRLPAQIQLYYSPAALKDRSASSKLIWSKMVHEKAVKMEV